MWLTNPTPYGLDGSITPISKIMIGEHTNHLQFQDGPGRKIVKLGIFSQVLIIEMNGQSMPPKSILLKLVINGFL